MVQRQSMVRCPKPWDTARAKALPGVADVGRQAWKPTPYYDPPWVKRVRNHLQSASPLVRVVLLVSTSESIKDKCSMLFDMTLFLHAANDTKCVSKKELMVTAGDALLGKALVSVIVW